MTARGLGSTGATDLGRRAARGGVVVMSGQAARIAVQVATVTVLARLLTPRDYGLIAMVMSVMAVANLVRDLGLSTAAIQAESLSKAQQYNLFWINTGVGGLLSLLAVIAAPVIAWIYGEPELAPVAASLAVVFFINGMATQYRADLNRRMRFGRLMVADVAAPLIGLPVAVVMAVNGADYWSLVGQQLAQYTAGLVMVAVMAGWLPRRPRRGVPMTGFLRFGWALVGSQLVNYVANNVDSLMIGTRLGAVSLGTYNRAFQLLMNPLSQVRGPTTTVALPVLSRLRHDARAFQRFVERGQVALGYTLVAGLGVLIGVSGPICEVFLGPRWHVGTVFALLAIAGAFDLLAYVGYWVYLAEGLMRDLLRFTLVAAAIKVACVVAGSWWGITGVAAGYALAPALCWPLSLWWLSRTSSVSVRPLYAGAGRIIGVTTVVALAARTGAAVVPASAPAAVAAATGVLAGAAAYAGLALLVRPVARDVRGLGTTLRGAMGRQRTATDRTRPEVWGPAGEAVEPVGGGR